MTFPSVVGFQRPFLLQHDVSAPLQNLNSDFSSLTQLYLDENSPKIRVGSHAVVNLPESHVLDLWCTKGFDFRHEFLSNTGESLLCVDEDGHSSRCSSSIVLDTIKNKSPNRGKIPQPFVAETEHLIETKTPCSSMDCFGRGVVLTMPFRVVAVFFHTLLSWFASYVAVTDLHLIGFDKGTTAFCDLSGVSSRNGVSSRFEVPFASQGLPLVLNTLRCTFTSREVLCSLSILDGNFQIPLRLETPNFNAQGKHAGALYPETHVLDLWCSKGVCSVCPFPFDVWGKLLLDDLSVSLAVDAAMVYQMHNEQMMPKCDIIQLKCCSLHGCKYGFDDNHQPKCIFLSFFHVALSTCEFLVMLPCFAVSFDCWYGCMTLSSRDVGRSMGLLPSSCKLQSLHHLYFGLFECRLRDKSPDFVIAYNFVLVKQVIRAQSH